MFDQMTAAGAHRCLLLNDEASGLRAVIALDSLALGPAVGGIRTLRYATDAEALADAQRLAAAMTLKCAIAGLDAGGGKTVVLAHDGLDRPAAFRRLGRYIEDLGGLYRCAGDLGTTAEDLRAAAEATAHVNTREAGLSEAAGRGVVNALRACAAARGREGVAGLTVAVQGCGAMGAAVARRLAAEGAALILADLDEAKARALAEPLGARVEAADGILLTQADILAPCAAGGVLTPEVALGLRAWAVCGAANNQLASPQAEQVLAARGIMFVPDFIASAGAVIAGVAPDLMGADPEPLIERLYDTALEVLLEARDTGVPATEVAAAKARRRLAAAAA